MDILLRVYKQLEVSTTLLFRFYHLRYRNVVNLTLENKISYYTANRIE